MSDKDQIANETISPRDYALWLVKDALLKAYMDGLRDGMKRKESE